MTFSCRPLLAGFGYFAAAFALGFLLGTIRVLWLEPALGPMQATLLEVPVMLAASWWLCGDLMRRFSVFHASQAVVMGASAFALLICAELALGLVAFDRTPAASVAQMMQGAGLAGLLGQLLFGLFPVLKLLQPKPK